MAAKTLALNMVMNTDQFRRDVRTAQDSIRDLSAQTVKAKQIAGNFKLAGFDKSQLDGIKSQFETTGKLQDKLFSATHSGLEVSLKDHDNYFGNLKVKWQDNESMLTLINQTETATRKKILSDYGKNTKSVMENIRTVMRLGAYTYAIKSVMDMGTLMLEARRKGESMFDAFVSGLPIINRLADSAKGLAKELSGLAAVEEISGKALSLDEKYGKLYETMSRNMKLAAAGNSDSKGALQAQFGYEDRLKEIESIEKEVKAIKDWNKSIEDNIKLGKVIGVGFGGAEIRQTLSPAEIEEARSKRIAVPNIDLLKQQAAKEYGTDGAAATDYMGNARATNERARKQLDEVQKVLDERRKAAVQSARAIESMYADMGDYGDEYYDAVNVQLDDQVRQFRAAGASDVDAAKWRANELKRIEDEISESRKNAIDRWVDHYTSMKEVSEDFAESYAAGLDDLGSKMTDWMKTGKMDWESWTNSLLTNWMDTLNKMAVAQMQQAIINPLISSLVGGVMGAFGGGAGAGLQGAGNTGATVPVGSGGTVARMHGGGIVGRDYSSRAAVPSSLFANAPRLHSGLQSDEFPAILQKGEQVIPKNQGGGSITPNIKVVIVRNEQEAFEEYLNSARGEKVLLKKQAKNQKYFQ